MEHVPEAAEAPLEADNVAQPPAAAAPNPELLDNVPVPDQETPESGGTAPGQQETGKPCIVEGIEIRVQVVQHTTTYSVFDLRCSLCR